MKQCTCVDRDCDHPRTHFAEIDTSTNPPTFVRYVSDEEAAEYGQILSVRLVQCKNTVRFDGSELCDHCADRIKSR